MKFASWIFSEVSRRQMQMLAMCALAFATTSLSTNCSAAGNSAEFISLGALLIGDSLASGISPSGEYVVGWQYEPLSSPSFIWSRSAGMVFIPNIPVSPSSSISLRPTDVANNGTTLFAMDGGETHTQNRLWHPTTGFTSIGDQTSRAYAITPDGDLVVGARSDPAYWTAANGCTVLGDLPIATTHHSRITGTAWAVSTDGTTIVGQADYNASQSPEPYTAFRWSAEEGMRDLGILPDYSRAAATAVSADGSIIAGRMGQSVLSHVFRWTEEAGAELLAIGGNGFPVMSDDGALIAWSGAGYPYLVAKLWTAKAGVRDLQDILIEGGADLGDWHLRTVTGISADGRTIVGVAGNSSGQQHAYVAVLPVPEPAALWLIAIGLFFVWRRETVPRHFERFDN